jgi:hypothetical protein
MSHNEQCGYGLFFIFVRQMLMKMGVLRIVRYNLRSFWELTAAVHAAVCGGSNRRTLKYLIL